MINIAIIEDSNEAASDLISCLERFRAEENEQFQVVRYIDADAFLTAKQPHDIIFMDIRLPNITELRKAIDIVKSHEEQQLVVNHGGEIVRISTAQVFYIEVRGHKLSYHTDMGVLTENGSLTKLEETLKVNNFMRCNACYLVNPRHIASIKKYTVFMDNGDELNISQPKRKNFIDELTNWMGQGKC